MAPPDWFSAALVRFAVYPALAYVAIGAIFWWKQESLIFPAPVTFEEITPASYGIRFEDLRIPVGTDGELHAWWVPAETDWTHVILMFHGNGYVLEDMVPDEIPRLHEIGANLLLVDYRGYGSSTAASPNERTVDEDAQAALDYLQRRRGIPIGKILVWGQSIGSGPATFLAVNNPGLAGLILATPFTSIDDAARGFWLFRFYPSRLILRTHFDNLSRIGLVEMPVFIVGGTADTLTPSWMAEKLYARAREPKHLRVVPHADHNHLLPVGGPALIGELRSFVQGESARRERLL